MQLPSKLQAFLIETGDIARFTTRYFLQGTKPRYEFKELVRQCYITEGLMGNKVINILPQKGTAPLLQPGDILPTPKTVSTDEMLQTLAITNNNIADISADLKASIRRINNSAALWTILGDRGLARNLQTSLHNISQASANANGMTRDLRGIISDAKDGKGSIGSLLRDTAFASGLAQAVETIRAAGDKADQLAGTLDQTVNDIHRQVSGGKGAVHTLLNDTILAANLNASMDNIRQGTAAFDQDMEALKHNFLLRGYFRKQAIQQTQTLAKTTNTTP